MTKNFAHRGFSAKYPENTMLAFRKAIEAGCDGIELDIHLSQDGKIVIIHDEDVRRTTNGSGLVQNMTLAELRSFDAGQQQAIPTLEEYFDLVEKLPIITNIELKNGILWYEGMEEKLINAVRKRNLEDRIIFSSFNHYSIRRCKSLAPDIRCGLLCGCWIINIGAYTSSMGIECIHPEYHSLTPGIIEEIRAHQVAINAWTINNSQDMEKLLNQNIDSIITNDPELLAGIIKKMK